MTLFDYHLIYIGFQRSRFTWNNGKLRDDHVKERLDRCVGNSKFHEEFEKAMVFHVELISLDHHIILLDCCFINKRSQKMFRFDAN